MKYFALYEPEWKKYWYSGLCYPKSEHPVHCACDWGTEKELAKTFASKEEAEVEAQWFNHEYVKMNVEVVEVSSKSKERVLY